MPFSHLTTLPLRPRFRSQGQRAIRMNGNIQLSRVGMGNNPKTCRFPYQSLDLKGMGWGE